MKIRLEIPKAQELPSQGRNSGSIPDGGAMIAVGFNKIFCGEDVTVNFLKKRAFYRAWLDVEKTDVTDAEFVFFVGWLASNNQLVFEDAHGDLHSYKPDEIEVV